MEQVSSSNLKSRIIRNLLPAPPIDAHLAILTFLEELPAVEINDDVPTAVEGPVPLTFCK